MNIYIQQQMINPKLNMIMEYQKIKINKANTLRRLKRCAIFTIFLARHFINT